MRIYYTDKRSVVDVAIRLGAPLGASKQYWMVPADPIWRLFTTCCYEIFDYPCDRLIGDSPASISDGLVDVRQTVKEELHNGFQDDSYYGSFLDNLRAFGSTMGFVPKSRFSPLKKETVMSHASLEADFRINRGSTWYIPGSASPVGSYPTTHFPPFTMRATYLYPIGTGSTALLKVSSAPVNTYSTRINYVNGYSLARLEDRLADLGSYYDNGWGGIAYPTFALFAYSYITDLQVERTLSGLDYSYKLRWNYGGPYLNVVDNPQYGWYVSNVGSIRFAPTLNEGTSSLPQGSYYEILSPGTVVMKLRSECLSHYGTSAPHSDPASFQTGEIWEGTFEGAVPLLIGYVSNPASRPSEPTLNMLRSEYSLLLENFRSDCDRDLKYFRGCSYLSASDALDSIAQSVNSNMLETISQLGSFFDVLPDFKQFVAAVTAFRGRPLASLGELVRLMASENLKLRFGTLPNYDLIRDVLPKVGEAIRFFQSLDDKPIVGYGKFIYNFPNGTFNRPDSRLIARSKVLLHTFPSGRLRDLLALKSIGLLPTPSASWALVPLSFVVDWVLNVSGRLEALENLSFLAGMDLNYMVHSYLIESPLQVTEWSSLGLQRVVASQLPMLRWYKRDLSRHVPIPHGPEKRDFGAPSGRPSWTIPGSLLVQKL